MSLDAQTIVDTVASADEATALSIIQAILSNRPELAPLLVNFAVPDLTYPPAKAMSGGREKGVIKSLSRDKGFGFIDCAELREVFQGDVLLHAKQAQEFAVGQPVTFAVSLNKDNKPQAYDLILDLDVMKGMGKGDAWSTSVSPVSPVLPVQPVLPVPPVLPAGPAVLPAASPQVLPTSGDAWNACGVGKGKESWSAGESWSGEGAKGIMMGMASAFGDGYGDAWKGKGKCKGKGKGCDDGKGKKGKVEKEEDLGQFQGVIKRIDPQSGVGFMECQDLKDVGCPDDVIVPPAQRGSLDVGACVQFTCIMKGGKPQAKDLVPLPPGKMLKT